MRISDWSSDVCSSDLGGVREIRAQLGQTLMEAAVDNDIPGITADCGGSCACATCHVVVADRWFDVVGPPSEMESGTLYFGAARRPTSRLPCQIVIEPSLDGLSVEVAKIGRAAGRERACQYV